MERPTDLGLAGGRLWAGVTDAFELAPHETALLVEACRCADRLDELHRLAETDGLVVDSPQGPKAHPAAVEARQQALALARLLASLRIPTEDDGRGQRRGAARGTYPLKAVQ